MELYHIFKSKLEYFLSKHKIVTNNFLWYYDSIGK
jgi:hypothetical protein